MSQYKNKIVEILISNRGGVPIRILFILVTFLLIGGSLFLMLENQKNKNKIAHRKAIELSDYGLQQMMMKISEQLNDDPSQIQGINKTEFNEGWYTVAVSVTQESDILTFSIESEGHVGTQSGLQKRKVTLKQSVVDGDTTWMPLPKE